MSKVLCANPEGLITPLLEKHISIRIQRLGYHINIIILNLGLLSPRKTQVFTSDHWKTMNRFQTRSIRTMDNSIQFKLVRKVL